MKTVAIVGTLDTKGEEFLFVKERLEASGLKTIVINAGVQGKPFFEPDIPNTQVAEVAGTTLDDLLNRNDRGHAMDAMMRGVEQIVGELCKQGHIDGAFGMGGSAGTTLGARAMQVLPVGVPKVLVSTLASGDTRPYVGVKDITMMYSVVDIAGINTLSTRILGNAASALAGMLQAGTTARAPADRPLIAATMFGVTTPCVTTAQKYLESNGYEVIIFHATGTGGMAMESLIESGFIQGVLDITTTEWCDELVGGVLSAGPHRLEAAAKYRVPQVISVGALDMVNFGSWDTVPAQFRNRNLYKHNASVTLMRTTVSENEALGRIIADKLNQVQIPTTLYLPLRGISAIDAIGQPFYGPEEDKILFQTIQGHLSNHSVEVREENLHINDPEFAIKMADRLIELMKEDSLRRTLSC